MAEGADHGKSRDSFVFKNFTLYTFYNVYKTGLPTPPAIYTGPLFKYQTLLSDLLILYPSFYT
jgi:hypothetical protein